MAFGLAFQKFPALDVTGSFCLLVVGLVVIPAMMLMPPTLLRGLQRVRAGIDPSSVNSQPHRGRDRGLDRPDGLPIP
jgi:hypothetical protein